MVRWQGLKFNDRLYKLHGHMHLSSLSFYYFSILWFFNVHISESYFSIRDAPIFIWKYSFINY